MSIFSSLFGNNTSTTTQQQQLAGPAANIATDLFNRASSFAAQPWSGYSHEQRIAPFNADQANAFDRTRYISENSGNLFGLLQDRVLGDQQSGALAGLQQPFSQANISQYMNPYVQQVLDPAIADLERRAALTRNQMNANAVRTGSFGGSRNMLGQMELERNTMNEIGRLSANERARAFNEAAQQYRADQQILPALQQRDYSNLAMLGTQNTARLGPEVNALLATGGLQQALDQARYDVNYGNFLENRDWDQRGLTALMQALGTGGTLGSTTRSSTEGPQPNALGQVIGATTGLVGSLGGLGSVTGALGGLASSAWDGISGWFDGGNSLNSLGSSVGLDSSALLGSLGGGPGDWANEWAFI